ncbi:hypothetical protein [Dyadobacter pollutisoli]|uniref:Uncharacterized protein n=1 Tax=Dyadobacter pollutisoli TaxID=2910158 RepID=A0A9E8NJ73_9BACT|nr:hypothetical protein [Dyadobacter pollutisoli]WAC15267.1 hypothetical protein ON006_15130 [Dyadobacter pollutisoli]
MKNEPIPASKAETTDKKLTSILYLLQTQLEEMKDEADRSYELHKIGEKTDLVKYIEQRLDDPFGGLVKMSNNLDSQLKDLLNVFVKHFLRSNRELISSAYLDKTQREDLNYSIILNEDSLESRIAILNFYEIYDQIEPTLKFPVHFQFVPDQLADRISYKEKLDLSDKE